MARVTVEDCVLRVPNRFDLAVLAAQRSRELTSGSALTVERDNDKNPVVALREIADGTVSVDVLRDSVVKGHQRHLESDEPEEEVIELMAGEEEALSQRPAALGPDGHASDEVPLEMLEEESGDGADEDGDGFEQDAFADESLASDDAFDDEDAADNGDGLDLAETDSEGMAEEEPEFGEPSLDEGGTEDPILR